MDGANLYNLMILEIVTSTKSLGKKKEREPGEVKKGSKRRKENINWEKGEDFLFILLLDWKNCEDLVW